ncbi:hypothetical protein [Mucilaginibacter segetis]|uniref:Uncharacterized protein n=1 Tax=Mucilaginibacter segetis TaxID=2793071 RepID=A0A934PVH9_9SPHI|nr:hypothetical protein [Mucilaginibacter segetis]MBK0380312.1 hypothetical protein [Mucilaginibacter segetis]
MTFKSFWTIIIKMAGLYIGWQIIISVPQLISVFQSSYSRDNYEQITGFVFLYGLQIAIYLCLSIICLFKSSWFVSILRLAEDFREPNLQLNLHRASIIKVIVILLGGIMFLNGFPGFCANLLRFLQTDNGHAFFTHPQFPWLVFSGLELLIGYCMMAYSSTFVTFIELQRRKS